MKKITILISAFTIISFQLIAQKSISGTVTDADKNEPLEGATITVKNTTIGTSTGSDGTFELYVPEMGKVLVFSFVGMINQEIEIGEQKEIDVALRQDTLSIDGVVITALGIPKEKKALGYSVQELSGKEINTFPNTNVTNSLAGKVAGVQVTSTSGSPGASAYITIRGSASIDGDNQPLFVVDGVPVSNAVPYSSGWAGADVTSRITDINPEDIESVSVLKGGAATALYGLRAANGAIIITTKGGSKTEGKKVNVTLNTSVTFDRVSQLPELQTRYGQGLNGDWISGNFASWGPRLDSCSYSKNPDIWTYPDYDVDGAIVSKNNQNATGDPINIYDPYKFFQTGISTNNLLSLSGGSDKATYYNSISYTYINGVVPNSNWKRFNMKVGGEASLSKKFKILGSITYFKTGGDHTQKGYNWSGVMMGLTTTPPTFDNEAGYELANTSQRNYQHGNGFDNPYWSVNKNNFKDDVNRMIGFAGFNWYATKWLMVFYKLGGDIYNVSYKNYYAVGSNEFYNGAVYLMNLNRMDINSDLILQAEHRFNEHWGTKLKLGHNIFGTSVSGIDAMALGLDLPGFYNLNNSNDVTTAEFSSQVRRAGIFGELELSYNNMVYLTLTGRNDWSTTLPEQNNSFFYPSASLGWIFTDLAFLKDNKILPYGKIRISVAQVANDPGPYNTLTGYNRARVDDRFTYGLTFPLLGYTGFSLSNNQGNPELKPEKTNSWEVGIDLKFLNNRLAVDFTYFNNYSDGLLVPVGLSGASGFYYIDMNAAGMSSKGIEAVVYTRPVQQPNWLWDCFFNFTRIENIVEKMPDDIDMFQLSFGDPSVAAKEGYPYQSFFGFDWYRDEDGNVLIEDNPEESNYGFPVGYNTDTVIYLGQVQPDWTLGWTNNLKWKNLTFTFLLEYKKGGHMLNETRGSLYYLGAYKDQESREPGDEVVFDGVKASDGSPNDIKVVKGQNWYFYGQGSINTGPSSPYIEKTGWIRLREIALTYSFGKEILKSSFIKGLDVYFACKNLWLKTDYSGIDPETNVLGYVNAQGLDSFNNPGTKSYTIGLRVLF